MHPNVQCSTVYNRQDMEATKMSINRGIDKDIYLCTIIYTNIYNIPLYIYIYIYIYNGILLSHKKKLNNAICSNMDGPRDDHIFFFINLFIYLFLAVLGLRFCAGAFSSCGERGPLFIAVHGPLTIAASLIAEHRLQTRRLSSCGSRA